MMDCIRSNIYLTETSNLKIRFYGIIGALAARDYFHIHIGKGLCFGVGSSLVAIEVLNNFKNEKHPYFTLAVTIATFAGTSFISRKALGVPLKQLLPGIAVAVLTETFIPQLFYAAVRLKAQRDLSFIKLEYDSNKMNQQIARNSDEKKTDLQRMSNALKKANERELSLNTELSFTCNQPATFAYDAYELQGSRSSMEDDHFYVESENFIFTGILDGHGGSQVSQYAAKRAPALFPEALRKADGNVRQALIDICAQIHEECRPFKKGMLFTALSIAKMTIKMVFQGSCPNWSNYPRLFEILREVGSTAVLSFIDKRCNVVFTATLGDAEGRVYREQQTFNLSGVRGWDQENERKRAEQNGEKISRRGKSKPRIEGCLNVSRALGDHAFKSVSHKPVVTAFQLQKGDRIVLGCDGLWDAYTDASKDSAKNLAESAAPLSNDNVSVITLEVS